MKRQSREAGVSQQRLPGRSPTLDHRAWAVLSSCEPFRRIGSPHGRTWSGPRRSTHDTPPDDRLEVRQHMTRLNRRRRLAAVAVLALAAVTASACSSSSGDSDDGGGGAYLVWDPYPQFADDSDWVA